MLGLSIEECIAASKLMTQGLKKKCICHLLVLQIWIHATQLDLPTSSPTTYSSVAKIGESDDICIFFSICSNTCHKVRESRNKKDGVTIGNSRATLYKCREMRDSHSKLMIYHLLLILKVWSFLLPYVYFLWKLS